MDFEERISALVEQLNRYAKEYYENDAPTVSDAEYDALYDELLFLEGLTGTVLPASPTHRVGGKPLEKFTQYKHLQRLYSLDKVKTAEGLDAFFTRIEKQLGFIPDVTVEHKFDGLTLSLTYEDGKLVRGATRGDGVVGEDVTAQIKTIKTIPLSIKYGGKIEIQGEGIMRLSAFYKYNETAKEPLKNARNGVAGAIRNLDPRVTASRNLDFVAYNIGYSDFAFSSQTEIHDFLKENGFFIDDVFVVTNEKNKVKETLNKIVDNRSELDFLIDGAVIKIDRLSYREELGFTEKFPRWAMAYKFPAEEASTMLTDVIWQVSRTGRLCPLAVLDPVDLMGATIKRATLNNILDIQKKGIKLNSRVFIRRSNDVIPEIMGVAEFTEDSREIEIPSVCPICGAPTRFDGTFVYCTNETDCAKRIINAIDHFASKPCMNIEGLSEKTVEQMYNELGVKSVDKLYDLTVDDLYKLDGFKDKKPKKLLDSIEKSKHTTAARFIFALGIPTIGKKASTQLSDKFSSFENVRKAEKSAIMEIGDFGEIMAENVVRFFVDEANNRLIDSLLSKGIIFETEEVTEGVFSGKNVVLTGTLSAYRRGKASEIIRKLGGTVSDTVGKAVNLVIAGEEAGSKLDKAKKLGIEIRDEAWFVEQIKDNVDA